jgi:hypothetical protein
MPGSFDEQVARLDPAIADLAERFVRVRLTDMRGLDLARFDLDYDLNWHALLLTPDGRVLGRFGGRDAETPGKYHSLKGLRHSLEQALARRDGGEPPAPASARAFRRAEDYPAAQRFSARACIHCHHVREFQREEKRRAGAWTADDEWVYPEPGSLGLTLDVDQGNRVLAVKDDSPAARAGLRPGDILTAVNRRAVASIMDVQHVLHHVPARGELPISWRRGTDAGRGIIALPDGWRKSDISWRWSLKSLPPAPQINGDDLSAAERQALGLDPKQLALRQNGFVPRAAEQAGLRVNDVIVGVDGRRLDMTARQFEVYIRLNFQPGQTAHYEVLRGKERLTLPIKLQ